MWETSKMHSEKYHSCTLTFFTSDQIKSICLICLCSCPTDRSAVWPSPATPVIQGPKGLIPGRASVQSPPLPPLCEVAHEGKSSVHRPAVDWSDWQQTSTTLLDHRGIQTQLRRQEQTQCAGPTGETFCLSLGAFLLCLNLVGQTIYMS